MKQNIRKKGIKAGSRFWSHRQEDKNKKIKIRYVSQKRRIKANESLGKIRVRFYKNQYAIIYFSKDNLLKAIKERKVNAYVKNMYIKRNENKSSGSLLSMIPTRMCRDCFVFFNNYPTDKIIFIADLTEVYSIGIFIKLPLKDKSPLGRPMIIEFLTNPIKISDHLKFDGNFYIRFDCVYEYKLLTGLMKHKF